MVNRSYHIRYYYWYLGQIRVASQQHASSYSLPQTRMDLFSRQSHHPEKNWGRGVDVRLRALTQASLSVARLGESLAGGLTPEKLMVVGADGECL